MTQISRHRVRVLGLLVALAVSLGATTMPAAAKDTSAVAVNTKDGSTLFRFAFSVRQIMGGVVDQTNAAVAYASCNECTTVAISVQILLVSGTPDEVTPTNLAVALNESCTECQTLASAYQFVFGTGEELRFTSEGRKQIADIRKRFKDLRKSGLTTDEIKAQADALAQELRQVLVDEVTVRGDEGKKEQGKEKKVESGATGSDASQDETPDVEQGSGATGPAANQPAAGGTTPPSSSQTSPTQTAPSSTTPTQSTTTTPPPTTTTPPPSTGTTAP